MAMDPDAPIPTDELDWGPTLAHLPWLQKDDPGFGQLVEAQEHPDGGFTMPYEGLSERSMELVNTLTSTRVVSAGIDWSRWLDGDGSDIAGDRTGEVIAVAPLDDVRRLLVSIVRAARFNEGIMLDALQDGTVRRLLERVEALTR